MSELEAEALSRTWFYPFRLPGGGVTPTYDGGVLDSIHFTRRQMLDDALASLFGEDFSALSAVDIACHQGWFACHLAERGFGRVLALDARKEHVSDTRLMRDLLGYSQIEVAQRDVHDTRTDNTDGPFDLTLCFGLIYHLENPVGALRVARALTRRACLVETQVMPGLTGVVDYGSYRFVRPLKGSFGIIDETGETHGREASTTGICLVPSVEALLWILRKIGFSSAEVLPVPEDGYEQLRYGKRVMVLARA